MAQVWFKNRRVKWRKEIRDWCSSEKYRFHAKRLYDNNKFPEAIPPNESPWAAADEHTTATNTQGEGLVPHSSNELWSDRQQNIIQATSSSFSGNLCLPRKDSNLSKFPGPSDSTFLHKSGVAMMQNSGTVHAKARSHSKTNNLQNSTQFLNPPNRNVLGNNSRIISSSPMRDAFYGERTSARDGNIWLSGENSSFSQNSSQLSSPDERQNLSNGYSSIIRDACRLDRGALQSCARPNILQNSTQSPSLNKTKVVDKATSSRSEMRDADAMNINTWLCYRGESFVQSFQHPTGNKDMNSGDGMMRDSSPIHNINLRGDAGGINGITWLPGDNAVLFQNCSQSAISTEYEAFNNGNNVMGKSSFMGDRGTDVMNGNRWLPDENSNLSQKCITFSSSTESKAFYNDANIMPENDVVGNASEISDAKLKNESNCLPGANAGLSEICIEYQEPSEMLCAGVLGNPGLMCDAQPSIPNKNDSFSLTNEVDQIVLHATKTSDIAEDILNPLCVPRDMQMEDINDHGVSFLHDLMAIINEEENLWC